MMFVIFGGGVGGWLPDGVGPRPCHETYTSLIDASREGQPILFTLLYFLAEAYATVWPRHEKPFLGGIAFVHTDSINRPLR